MKSQFLPPLKALLLLSFSLALSGVSMAQPSPQPLKQSFAGRFLIGAALSDRVLRREEALTERVARTHFSAFTSENSLKPAAVQPRRGAAATRCSRDAVQPRRGEFHFEEADALVEMARQSGAVAVGHVLVWHSQTPAWFNQDAAGKPLPRDIAPGNLREHIAAKSARVWPRLTAMPSRCFCAIETRSGASRCGAWTMAVRGSTISRSEVAPITRCFSTALASLKQRFSPLKSRPMRLQFQWPPLDR